MRPIDAMKRLVRIVSKEDSLGHKLVIEFEERTKIIESTCRCLCSYAIMESSEKVEPIKDPLSAPF